MVMTQQIVQILPQKTYQEPELKMLVTNTKEKYLKNLMTTKVNNKKVPYMRLQLKEQMVKNPHYLPNPKLLI